MKLHGEIMTLAGAGAGQIASEIDKRNSRSTWPAHCPSISTSSKGFWE